MQVSITGSALLSAFYAECERGIVLQPSRRDVLTTSETMAELALVDPHQRSIDRRMFDPSAALLRQCHGLHLHRIDAREPADAFLVEHHWRAVRLGNAFLPRQRLTSGEQLVAKVGKVSHRFNAPAGQQCVPCGSWRK